MSDKFQHIARGDIGGAVWAATFKRLGLFGEAGGAHRARGRIRWMPKGIKAPCSHLSRLFTTTGRRYTPSA